MKGPAALLIAAALCAVGCGTSRERAAQLDSLVRAERAFASVCAAKGIKTGFLSCLAEDAVVFRPRPVSGVDWYSQSEESGGRLAWEPVYADISASGDLGYTTGPWTFSDEDGRAAAHGEYVSVWRRTPGGDWKVAIDVGISHAAPDSAIGGPGEPRYGPAGGVSHSDSAGGKAERRRLSEASQGFFRAWSARGMEAAYRETASDEVLVLRPASCRCEARARRSFSSAEKGFRRPSRRWEETSPLRETSGTRTA